MELKYNTSTGSKIKLIGNEFKIKRTMKRIIKTDREIIEINDRLTKLGIPVSGLV